MSLEGSREGSEGGSEGGSEEGSEEGLGLGASAARDHGRPLRRGGLSDLGEGDRAGRFWPEEEGASKALAAYLLDPRPTEEADLDPRPIHYSQFNSYTN